MIVVINNSPVRDGAADGIVERFAGSGEHVEGFPGFVSMEVLRSEDASEVLVVTKWRDRAAFDSWVGSEEFQKVHSGGGRESSQGASGDERLRGCCGGRSG